MWEINRLLNRPGLDKTQMTKVLQTVGQYNPFFYAKKHRSVYPNIRVLQAVQKSCTVMNRLGLLCFDNVSPEGPLSLLTSLTWQRGASDDTRSKTSRYLFTKVLLKESEREKKISLRNLLHFSTKNETHFIFSHHSSPWWDERVVILVAQAPRCKLA